MGSINFTGLSSGLDTNAIVEKLLEIERQPLSVIELQQATLEAKQAAFGSINTKLVALDSAVSKISTSSGINLRTASTSDSAILTATANANAQVGTFNISKITSLAKAHSEAFTGVTDQDAAFASGTTFSFKVDGETYSIDIDDLPVSEQNLTGLRDAINDTAGDVVQASIINTGNANDPYKLVIQSKETGEANRITDISTDITVNTSGGTVALATVGSEQILGTDAKFTFNGVEIQRSTNTIDDVITGLTLNLKATSDTPVSITVEQDGDALKENINSFITAYNELNAAIQEQFKYDEEAGSAGLLSGDSTLRQIQSTMQQLVIRGVTDADGNRYSLATIGIEFSKEDGSLSLNEETFEDALANSDVDLFLDVLTSRGVTSGNQAFFVSSGTNTQAGTYGISVSSWDGSGNVQGSFSLNGQTYAATGSGEFLTGAAGTPVEGLRIRIANGATGNLGSVTYSVGIASQLDRTINSFTSPLTGLLPKLDSQYEEELARLDDQIEEFEERLALRERELKAQFTAAEEALSSLQSQQASLQAQLSSLS